MCNIVNTKFAFAVTEKGGPDKNPYTTATGHGLLHEVSAATLRAAIGWSGGYVRSSVDVRTLTRSATSGVSITDTARNSRHTVYNVLCDRHSRTNGENGKP